MIFSEWPRMKRCFSEINLYFAVSVLLVEILMWNWSAAPEKRYLQKARVKPSHKSEKFL